MQQARSKAPLILFAAVILLSIAAVFLIVSKCNRQQDAPTTGKGNTAQPTEKGGGSGNITLKPDGNHVDDVNTGHTGTPEELVGHISEVAIRANDTGDIKPLIQLLGQGNLSPAQQQHLQQLAATARLKLDPGNPFSSIHNSPNRWSLNLADRNRIYLDLSKNDKGQWQVNKITLPGNNPPHPDQTDPDADPDEADAGQDAEATVRKFIEAIVKLDPAEARKHIDTSKVSYARVAALCIIFEEGEYQLIKQKALRKVFLRDTAAGWLARVEASNTGTSAMFAINTKRKDADSPWQITEINLDKLLADYATRVSGGDIHYTPLINNPKGGDSLVIYFDLDSNELTRRTERQLTIVANILKEDDQRKLTISGHTDALGTDRYNFNLSQQRADQVMRFLATKGVPAGQMNIVGYGKSKPRQPNTTEDGHDDPDGRRANRRAEIYLDF